MIGFAGMTGGGEYDADLEVEGDWLRRLRYGFDLGGLCDLDLDLDLEMDRFAQLRATFLLDPMDTDRLLLLLLFLLLSSCCRPKIFEILPKPAPLPFIFSQKVRDHP